MTLPPDHPRVVLLRHVLNGVSSFVELRKVTGWSNSTVRSHLHRLRAQGFVTWEHGKPSSIRPVVDKMPEEM